MAKLVKAVKARMEIAAEESDLANKIVALLKKHEFSVVGKEVTEGSVVVFFRDDLGGFEELGLPIIISTKYLTALAKDLTAMAKSTIGEGNLYLCSVDSKVNPKYRSRLAIAADFV